MDYKLTPAEQETIITWDNELDTADVYTHDSRLIRKLEKLAEQYPEAVKLARTFPTKAVTYKIPKKLIRIYPPVSEEWKEKQRKHAEEGKYADRFKK